MKILPLLILDPPEQAALLGPYRCPHCQYTLAIDSQYNGYQIACPGCSRLVSVPQDNEPPCQITVRCLPTCQADIAPLPAMESPSEQQRIFASVFWCAEDLQALRPEWTTEQAEQFLEVHADSLVERMIEQGWDELETLLPTDD